MGEGHQQSFLIREIKSILQGAEATSEVSEKAFLRKLKCMFSLYLRDFLNSYFSWTEWLCYEGNNGGIKEAETVL